MNADRLTLLGVNHKTAPVHVREKLALVGGYETPLLALKKIKELKEVYLLSTCNRVELLFVSSGEVDMKDRVLAAIFGDVAGGVIGSNVSDYFYTYEDEAAAHHLFTVAASLDSMVVGEAQILGQIKAAYREASSLGCTGALLNKLLHRSFFVAKRVRNETGIGCAAVSISYAAVQLARKKLGGLDDKKVLVIGAGEMAELAVEHLRGQGIGEVVVANRTISRAAELAGRFSGKAVSLNEVQGQLQDVDIVISSTGAKTEILTCEDVRPIIKRRGNRPLFFIDIAVPRDLDPQLGELENVILYDIDHLNNVIAANRSEREKEAVLARNIIDEESQKFTRWRKGMALTPTIRAMRNKVAAICSTELERTLAKMPEIGDEERAQLEMMMKAIAAKVLHDPLVYLKNRDCESSNKKKIYTFRNIFKLENG